MLFQINKYHDKLNFKEDDTVDITSLETLNKSDSGRKILSLIQSGEYFEMPIIKNQQVTKNA